LISFIALAEDPAIPLGPPPPDEQTYYHPIPEYVLVKPKVDVFGMLTHNTFATKYSVFPHWSAPRDGNGLAPLNPGLSFLVQRDDNLPINFWSVVFMKIQKTVATTAPIDIWPGIAIQLHSRENPGEPSNLEHEFSAEYSADPFLKKHDHIIVNHQVINLSTISTVKVAFEFQTYVPEIHADDAEKCNATDHFGFRIYKLSNTFGETLIHSKTVSKYRRGAVSFENDWNQDLDGPGNAKYKIIPIRQTNGEGEWNEDADLAMDMDASGPVPLIISVPLNDD
jgi:hypothetical protein